MDDNYDSYNDLAFGRRHTPNLSKVSKVVLSAVPNRTARDDPAVCSSTRSEHMQILTMGSEMLAKASLTVNRA